VIPREGVESEERDFPLTIADRAPLFVIPREGVESDDGLIRDLHLLGIPVIPREGVESSTSRCHSRTTSDSCA
jgi:hypothetical protein